MTRLLTAKGGAGADLRGKGLSSDRADAMMKPMNYFALYGILGICLAILAIVIRQVSRDRKRQNRHNWPAAKSRRRKRHKH
jgi:hypothetical protein